MARIKETDDEIVIEQTASDDVQTVTITREQARKWFDNDLDNALGEDFDTALDLAQAEAAGGDPAIVILVIKPDEVPSAA